MVPPGIEIQLGYGRYKISIHSQVDPPAGTNFPCDENQAIRHLSGALVLEPLRFLNTHSIAAAGFTFVAVCAGVLRMHRAK